MSRVIDLPDFLTPAVRAAARKEKGGSPEDARRGDVMNKIVLEAPKRQTGSVISRIELVTPAAARALRDTAHFSRQRNISKANIDRLAAEMKAGRFTPGTQIYICVLPDGSELIVNGNHTLEAVAESGVPQVLTITRRAVADENEAGSIYAVFDIQKVRTWGDSLRATGAGEDVPYAEKIMSAIGVMENDFGQGKTAAASRLGRIERLEEYRDQAQMLANCMKGAPAASSKLVRRAAITAVALETLRYQPSAASEFWYRVAHDEGLVTGNPEKALLSWLRNVRGTSQKEHCRAAALAWNAAFREREIQFVKPNQMVAFFLLGTPWANGLEV